MQGAVADCARRAPRGPRSSTTSRSPQSGARRRRGPGLRCRRSASPRWVTSTPASTTSPSPAWRRVRHAGRPRRPPAARGRPHPVRLARRGRGGGRCRRPGRAPVAAVLGNHDLHADRGDEVVAVLEGAGVLVLDEAAARRSTSPATRRGRRGQRVRRGLRRRLRERVRRARDQGLRPPRRRCGRPPGVGARPDRRVGPAPGAAPLLARPRDAAGEPLEIYPFLGSYLLAEAIDAPGRRTWPCTATPTAAASGA